MNLKKQLSIIAKNKERERKEERREQERKLIRSEEEWAIADQYLQNLLKELAKKPLKEIGFARTKFVEIDRTSKYMLFPRDSHNDLIRLKNGSLLQISQVDIQRFCKQHKLKLRYLLDKDHHYKFSRTYNKWDTETYLIGIR